jgi:hypothetical protein
MYEFNSNSSGSGEMCFVIFVVSIMMIACLEFDKLVSMLLWLPTLVMGITYA